ncbi:hypothetical protein [Nocardia sp. NPDC055049]
MSSVRLQDASTAFKFEVNEIEAAFLSTPDAVKVTQYSMGYAPHVDGCIVSLWDSWNRFLRACALLSASGECEGISGVTYRPATARTEIQALQRLKNPCGTKIRLIHGEPNWYDLRQLPNILDELEVSNANQIIGAIGASSVILGSGTPVASPVAELQDVRNFVAHKTDYRLSSIRSLIGGGPDGDLHRYLWAKTRGGVERFSLWARTMSAIAENACH